MNTQEEFAEHISALRNQAGLSQEDFAYMCGIHPAHYGQIELGHVCPTIETAKRIANGLNCTLSELFQYDRYNPLIAETNKEALRLYAYLSVLEPSERKSLMSVIKTFVRTIQNAKGKKK